MFGGLARKLIPRSSENGLYDTEGDSAYIA
jgi:hypothetical protein